MFFIKFDNEEIKTEAQFGDWDHVPRDRKIKNIGLFLPLIGLEIEPAMWCPLPDGCSAYYCARLGVAPLGAPGVEKWIGYVLVGKLKGTMEGLAIEAVANPSLFSTRIVKVDELTAREDAWRHGG